MRAVVRRLLDNAFAQAILLLIVSAALGSGVNLVRPKSVPWGNTPAYEIFPHLELTEAAKELEAGDCLFLDARPIEFFQQSHVLNAISVPLSTPEAEVKKAVPVAHSFRRIIIYCEDKDCDAADGMARRMKRLGYDKLFVMEGGWRAWSEANQPSE